MYDLINEDSCGFRGEPSISISLEKRIGEALRHCRKSKGLKLREVSAASKFSIGYISQVEQGKYKASVKILRSLAQFYGMKLSELLQSAGE